MQVSQTRNIPIIRELVRKQIVLTQIYWVRNSDQQSADLQVILVLAEIDCSRASIRQIIKKCKREFNSKHLKISLFILFFCKIFENNLILSLP